MGVHARAEIPNYWAYAERYVLQDRMFAPSDSWSLPSHLYLVSEWSAFCSQAGDPASCVNALESPSPAGVGPYAWTDLTYLLHRNKVSWGYYVTAGTEPDCRNDAELSCVAVRQDSRTPGICVYFRSRTTRFATLPLWMRSIWVCM